MVGFFITDNVFAIKTPRHPNYLDIHFLAGHNITLFVTYINNILGTKIGFRQELADDFILAENLTGTMDFGDGVDLVVLCLSLLILLLLLLLLFLCAVIAVFLVAIVSIVVTCCCVCYPVKFVVLLPVVLFLCLFFTLTCVSPNIHERHILVHQNR